MVAFATVMGPLSQALGLSVVVERIIEFGKNVVEPAIRTAYTRAQPPLENAEKAVTDAEQLAQRDAQTTQVEQATEADAPKRTQASMQLQKLRDQLRVETDGTKRTALLQQIATLKDTLTGPEQSGELEERTPPCVILVEKATDPDEGEMLRAFCLQLLGLAVGILLATLADVQLFNAFLGASRPELLSAPVDHLLTGLLIGGGSAPVHTLIRFISDRKTTAEAAEVVTAEAPETKVPLIARATVAVVPVTVDDVDAGAYLDIPYEGGVDVDILEGVHRRAKNPDLVVFHHTAMHSNSTFDDVVKVIKSRRNVDAQGKETGAKWLTGYNCVILADGSIHAFCRWDRYGNHAVGYNRNSLGISFNGNFETNPHVPYSNADGRYGAVRPTDAQLRAGARVVALWTYLYPIPPDFTKSIIPHRQISSKACPGSNFPYQQFEQLVTFYRDRWQSTDAQQRINAFKQKPYLFV